MTSNEQVVKPIRESPLKRISRTLLPIFLVLGGLYLFQPHLGLVGDSFNGEVFKGIGLSWENPFLKGEQWHGLTVGGVYNTEGRLTRLTRVSASSY